MVRNHIRRRRLINKLSEFIQDVLRFEYEKNIHYEYTINLLLKITPEDVSIKRDVAHFITIYFPDRKYELVLIYDSLFNPSIIKFNKGELYGNRQSFKNFLRKQLKNLTRIQLEKIWFEII